jgi:hypothetical protein
MQQVKYASSTNSADNTVVKVTSSDPAFTWLSPADAEIFHIRKDAVFPAIIFEFRTQAAGVYEWSWAIEWEVKVSGLNEQVRNGNVVQIFKDSGSFISSDTRWAVDLSGQTLGGKLTVTVTSGKKTLVRSVLICGKNPEKDDVASYLATLEGVAGFDKLIEQETGFKHFLHSDGEPVVAFDKGYGIAQVTRPAPSYEQAWSWKANIIVGASIYREKVRAAAKYLGQADRNYTTAQLEHEALSRWNGGSYHEWDQALVAWVRKKNILCDANTGNIGWLMDDEVNKDKPADELHERDKDTFKNGKKGQSDNHSWAYSGVCYADHVLAK